MVDQKFKKARRVLIVFSLAIVIIFGVSGCWNRNYRGDYPELFTVAMNSLLGATGLTLHMRPDPMITIMEEDNYGRVLFLYAEGGEVNTLSLLISQKSDDRHVYFYPHYNFISFETFEEMSFWVGPSRELRLDRFHPEVIEKIGELKEVNDWNQELNLDIAVRARIVLRNEDGPVRNRRLIEAYNTTFGDDAARHPIYNTVFLTTDDYGRSVYLGTSKYLREEYEDLRTSRQRHVVMFFQPDGTFDEVKGVMELVDTQNYQTALREFKELNGWNQPFERSTPIILWISLGLIVIVGISGFMVIRLYLKKKLLRKDKASGGSTYTIGGCIKKVIPVLYLIVPTILVNGLIFHDFTVPSFWYYVLFVYLTTIIGIILFFIFAPCRFNALIVGLLISPMASLMLAIAMLIFMSPEPSSLLSLVRFPIFFYALPFTMIALVVRRIKERKQAEVSAIQDKSSG